MLAEARQKQRGSHSARHRMSAECRPTMGLATAVAVTTHQHSSTDGGVRRGSSQQCHSYRVASCFDPLTQPLLLARGPSWAALLVNHAAQGGCLLAQLLQCPCHDGTVKCCPELSLGKLRLRLAATSAASHQLPAPPGSGALAVKRLHLISQAIQSIATITKLQARCGIRRQWLHDAPNHCRMLVPSLLQVGNAPLCLV